MDDRDDLKQVRQLLSGGAIARHAIASCVMSLDDDPARPSERLLELAAVLPKQCIAARHAKLDQRTSPGSRWHTVFPGEHYRLLTAICQLLKPKTVFEFGTDAGMGTLAIAEGMAGSGKLITVDVVPWDEIPATWLKDDDFNDNLEQAVLDMGSDIFFSAYRNELENADFIFVDGPKDVVTETVFLARLSKVRFKSPPIVMFDDIRVPAMLRIWREIRYPKMDFTSFGHWSGTGLVDWRG